MNSKSNSIIKYLGSAMAVGGSVMLGTALVGENKSISKKAKKTAERALEAVDNAITSIENIIK